jgi:hypothetical protein
MGPLFSGPILGFGLLIGLVGIIAGWKVFEKAGQPGWAVLIPIFNAYIILKIAGRPGWWLLLWLIPIVNVVISAIVAIDVAKSFGKSAVFGFVLIFLLCGFGYLILGFGSARYVGPAAAMPEARMAGAL